MNTRAYEVSGMKPYREIESVCTLKMNPDMRILQIYTPVFKRLTLALREDIEPLENYTSILKDAFEADGWINVSVKELGAAAEVKGEEN